nr:PREDICTED: uncharacterized protein LOC104963011 [Notothenia coriiceps]
MEKEQQRNSPAYRWEPCSQTTTWLSPSRLRLPELGSNLNLSDSEQNIRRGGSTRSLQLDYKVISCSGDRGGEQEAESERRAFHWERNQSGEWVRKRLLEKEEKRRHDGEGQEKGEGSRDRGACEDQQHDSGEENSSPVYEEYRERDPEHGEDGLYDTLPPTRRAYEGYPSSPSAVNLHPAQLLPPLRAWDLQTGEWRGSQEGRRGLGSGSLSGSGDELERLLNLVSLRARRATRTNRASTQSDPSTDWEELK